MDTQKLLMKNPLFNGLDEADLARLVSISKHNEYSDEEPIVTEGEPADCIHVILSGDASVCKENEEIAVLHPGDSVGDVALLDHLPRSATVKAINKVQTISFLLPDIAKLSGNKDSIPGILKINFAKRLSQYLRKTNLKTLDDRKKHREELTQLTHFDVVTGLPNQYLLTEHVSELLETHPKQMHVLYQLEISDYKEVEDAMGDDLAETLLNSISERLSTCLTDIELIARVGYNQFMIVQSGVASPDNVPHMAGRIARLFTSPFMVDDENIFTHVYIGVAHYPDDGHNVKQLIKHAGLALDAAKLLEPNSYSFYDESLNLAVEKRRQLTNELYQAFEADQFELFFQPQINLTTDEIVGAEALIRWPHPEKGMIPPDEFIPIVEQTGLIIKLGHWIFKMACSQAKMWSEAGHPIRIAVNLSAIQFKQVDLVEKLASVLTETQVDPSLIELEITESIMMDNLDETIDKLRALSNVGFVIAIDDFGTGYSSLSYLRKLTIDKIKIDQSFVRDIETSEEAKDIIKCIVTLARGLNLYLIAEGIESDAHAQFLKSLQCDEGQGYFYSKPLSAHDFEEKCLRMAEGDKYA